MNQEQKMLQFGFHVTILAAIAALLAGCDPEPCEPTIPPLAEVRYPGTGDVVPWEIQPADDSGFIIAGYRSSRIANPGMTLVKTDSNGNVQWLKTYASDNPYGFGEGRGVRQAGDGGYIVVGYSGGPIQDPGLVLNPTDLEVLKVNSAGDVVWSRTVKGDADTVGYAVCVNPDGSIAVAGSSGTVFLPGDEGVLLLKFDADGNELWRRQFLAGVATTPWDIVATSDGGYAIAGHSEQPFGTARSRDIYAVKLNGDGEKQWEFLGGTSIPFAGYRSGRGIVETRDGGYAMVGTSTDDAEKLVVVKLDQDGDLLWARAAPGERHASGYDIVETADGSLVAVGESYSLTPTINCAKFYAVRIREDGALLWTGRFDSGLNSAARSVVQRPDGTFIIVGETGLYSFTRGPELTSLITDVGPTAEGEGDSR